MSKTADKTTICDVIFNLAVVISTIIGLILMLTAKPEPGSLQAAGIANFKFYTVLSNVFCGITALIRLAFLLSGRDTSRISFLKLAGVCGVTVTFAVVAFFFGPVWGFAQFYTGGNLFFHLLEPVAAIAGFCLSKKSYMPLRYAVFAAVPTLLYGCGYLLNILINGIGGPWPGTNDFYAFLSWGWPVGILIFAVITGSAFAVACIFRKINNGRV